MPKIKFHFRFVQDRVMYKYIRKIERELLRLKSIFRVVTVTGPRQSGKTTVCKMAFPDYHYINLEDEETLNELELNRKDYIERHCNGLIIDEVQRMPEILSAVQVIVDAMPDSNIVLTSSNNLLLSQKVSQSLAGRTALLTLLPLSLSELSENDLQASDFAIMFRGFYPAIWANDVPPTDAYRQYYNTYIQRDIRQLTNIRHLNEFRKFIVISASRIGCEFNAQSISNELGVSLPTVQEWMNVLEATYVAFKLQPFYRNIGKRLVKTPKVYFYDIGLVCYLLGINNEHQLETHPLRGQIFENMVVVECLKHQLNGGKDNNIYFYRDKGQHEVDIIFDDGLQSLKAFEVKLSPTIHPDFYKNLQYFRSIFKQETQLSMVINTGREDMPNNVTGHINYRHLDTFLNEFEKGQK